MDCTDGSQAILHLVARAISRVVFGYGDTDDDGLARELPLLTAGEEAQAGVIDTFVAVLQKAKQDG